MGFFTVIPLMVIPIIIYNIIAWGGQVTVEGKEMMPVGQVRTHLNETLLSVPMSSGVDWIITPGYALIVLSLVMLFFELLRSTEIGRAAVMNHAVSMVLFIICLIEFLMFGAFATSVFFIITLMALMDVMAGFMVTIASARRDIGVTDGFHE